MQFWGSQFVQSLKSWEELKTWCARNFTSIAQILNGKVMFRDNMFCQIVDISSATGSNYKVEHRLGVIPIGFVLIYATSAGADVYAGTTAWTNTAIYLSGTFPTSGKIIIIGA